MVGAGIVVVVVAVASGPAVAASQRSTGLHRIVWVFASGMDPARLELFGEVCERLSLAAKEQSKGKVGGLEGIREFSGRARCCF